MTAGRGRTGLDPISFGSQRRGVAGQGAPERCSQRDGCCVLSGRLMESVVFVCFLLLSRCFPSQSGDPSAPGPVV